MFNNHSISADQNIATVQRKERFHSTPAGFNQQKKTGDRVGVAYKRLKYNYFVLLQPTWKP